MPTLPSPVYDAMVVGGGPAGLAAALQLARFNRTVLCFDGGMGRSTYHQVNHNYLGFPGGVSAREFRAVARRQVAEYPVAFVDDTVVAVERHEYGAFVARTAALSHFAARTVTFATGVRDRFPAFPGWQDYVGRSIFWCIVCDGYATRGKRIVIAGNDDDAAVTALQFLQFTHRVTMLTNARDCAITPPVQQALAAHAVPLVVGELAGVAGTGGILGALHLQDGQAIDLDYLFSLQGCTPNSALARGLGVTCSPGGYIITDAAQSTDMPGVFAAGDVTRDLAHQVSTAVHEGNSAATAANYYLYEPFQRHDSYVR